MGTPLKLREGFWKSKDEPRLPMPQARGKPWKGKAEFLVAFDKVEAKAMKRGYKGSSTCRICGMDRNGADDHRANGWVWPEGYRHYIEEHNVRPSLAFQEMILGEYVGDRP